MRRKRRASSLLRLATLGLTAAAIMQELRKPAPERQWHGRVARFVPYDFRFPTPERIRSAWWNPDSEQILMPQVFGVGWTVNLGRVFRLLRS